MDLLRRNEGSRGVQIAIYAFGNRDSHPRLVPKSMAAQIHTQTHNLSHTIALVSIEASESSSATKPLCCQRSARQMYNLCQLAAAVELLTLWLFNL